MARAFLQPAVCVGMLAARGGADLIGWPQCPLELGQAFIEVFAVDRPDIELPDCAIPMASRPDFRFRLSQTAWLIPFWLRIKIRRWAAASCVRAAKSPARIPVRAADVISVNTLFWKILVTRVKRFFGAICREGLRERISGG